MKIGYARISADQRTFSLQTDALESEGCERMFYDRPSGAKVSRNGLADALASCGPGDVLTVWRIDRLGRTLLDLVNLVENLNKRGIGLKVLAGAGTSLDTTKPEGLLHFTHFAALAEFERELIRERTIAGMDAAKRRGTHVGRPRKLPSEKLELAGQLLAGGKSQREVAKALGVAVSTLREAMKGYTGLLVPEQSDIETLTAAKGPVLALIK